jgi:3'-5' exoribonuclease
LDKKGAVRIPNGPSLGRKRPKIHDLLRAIFIDDADIARRFREAPAAISMHHPWASGLLAHSISVARLADDVARRYPNELDRSLLIAGALLHDLAKIDELSWRGAYSYTTPGNLIGHIVQGAILLRVKADRMPGFPERTLEKLQHLVLSHHGELAYGAAREPMMAEAIVLYHLDNIDARIEAFARAVSESSGGDPDWTEFNRMFGRRLYKGE